MPRSADDTRFSAVFPNKPTFYWTTPCHRSRLKCAGFHACRHVNPKLLKVERYELDSESLEEVVQAQIETRTLEADSAEKLTLMYVLCFK
jgi:hypothetical protein